MQRFSFYLRHVCIYCRTKCYHKSCLGYFIIKMFENEKEVFYLRIIRIIDWNGIL